ncbi:DNA mismatch repair protein MutS [Acidobacteria bacterium AB60]|nr:DNA mismatch repair protein MutS [Acidobacteria bacterium AB60]
MSLPPEDNTSAASEYGRRLGDLESLQGRDRHRDRVFGVSKLFIAMGALVAAGLTLRYFYAVVFLAALAIVFMALFVGHERLIQRMQVRSRTLRYYERGMARLNGTWQGRGATGERYLDPAHVYARDLDIFGDASLFQYLSTALTQPGEETLARWLLEAVPVEGIAARQGAIRDLATRLNFRENLASAGEIVRKGVDPGMLILWGESAPILSSRTTKIVTTVLGIAWLAGIVAWVISGSPLPLLALSVLNFAYAHRLHARLERAAGSLEKAAADLRLTAALLGIIERETFSSPCLMELQAKIKREGEQPSAAIKRLARLAEAIQSRHSLFARPFDLATFWSAQLVFIAERWQRQFGPLLRTWFDAVGEMEALGSLATLCYEHPEYVFPEFASEAPLLEAVEMAHPLLPASAVSNNVTLRPGSQLMILSGPNMAGKSTFIRSVGVNAVLAQCGSVVRASQMRLSPLRVAASICILDSLSGGVSRFYAEIRRVKVITDLAEGSVPVLFLLDELLSGTNSHDRFIGTRFVLQQLVSRGAIGIVSTHDLALARIPDEMSGTAVNQHFEDRVEDGHLKFDYKLKPGVVQTSNALTLMRSIGIGVTES